MRSKSVLDVIDMDGGFTASESEDEQEEEKLSEQSL